MTLNATMPAFPLVNPETGALYDGLTKSEYFAAMGLQGYLVSYAVDGAPQPKPEQAAKKAVEYADALLLELEKTAQ